MCGRFTLHSGPERIRKEFGIGPAFSLQPRYNIAPGENIATVGCNREGERGLALLRWGLVPAWAKAPGRGIRMINARAETLADKPAFRTPLRTRRCLVPADGFYEWKAVAGGKQPFFIYRQDHGLLAIAGLWDHWKGDDGTVINSVTLITTAANEDVSAIHDRMPVILPANAYDTWLDPRQRETGPALELIAREECPRLACHPVSDRVNRPGEDDKDILVPETPRT